MPLATTSMLGKAGARGQESFESLAVVRSWTPDNLVCHGPRALWWDRVRDLQTPPSALGRPRRFQGAAERQTAPAVGRIGEREPEGGVVIPTSQKCCPS